MRGSTLVMAAMFLVDLDSECLECALGGVAAGASGGGGDGVIEQFDEPRGGGEGGVFAFADDGGGDFAGESFVPVGFEDAGEVAVGVGIEDFRRGNASELFIRMSSGASTR